MTRSLLPLILCAVMGTQARADDLLPKPPSSPQSPPAQTPGPAQPAQAPSQQLLAEARAACDTDIQKLCPTVQPGGGRIFACLKQHKDDHAWLNGANQYVMSDDPNFNPNGNLNGNWTSLQPVRPQP
jgi:Cysteine rich repeat